MILFRSALTAVLLAASLVSTSFVPASAQEKKSRSALSGFDNSNSKDPYKIDANRLDVDQNANKATYAGDVVVVQGTMTMRCVTLVIFFNRNSTPEASRPAQAQNASVGANTGGLRRLECHGVGNAPVTINKEKQTATAQLLVYEATAGTVTMTGNVVMSDGENVQAGEKMIYNTKSSIGRMEGGRVRGIFTPGSDPGQKPKN